MFADVLVAMRADKVFDRSALDGLAEEVASTIAVHFAEQFLELLPNRVKRIQAPLSGQDGGAALDAVLSLKVTSMTVGAEELGRCALAIEDFVRSGDLRSASLRAADLDELAAEVAVEIADYIESAG